MENPDGFTVGLDVAREHILLDFDYGPSVPLVAHALTHAQVDDLAQLLLKASANLKRQLREKAKSRLTAEADEALKNLKARVNMEKPG